VRQIEAATDEADDIVAHPPREWGPHVFC